MIFVRLISTCRFAGLSSIIVALRVEFNFAIHTFKKGVNSQSKFYSGQGGGTLFNRKSGIEFNMRSFLPERGK